jgi:hypothetical protein
MENLQSPNESVEYRAARNALLNDEIALRAEIEAVAAKRRALPLGGEVPQDYVFERIGKTSMPEKVKMPSYSVRTTRSSCTASCTDLNVRCRVRAALTT